MVLSISCHADLYTQEMAFAGRSDNGAKGQLPQQQSEPDEIKHSNTLTLFPSRRDHPG